MKNTLNYFLAVVSIMLISGLSIAQGYKPGDTAKDFKLKNIDGKVMSLSEMKGVRGAIVVFTCNHCPFSVKYEDRIIALDNMYKEKGFPVVAINPNDATKEPDDSFDKMVVRAKEKGFTFPYLHDETQEIAKAYGASRTPHVYILKKSGDKFIVEYVGAIDDNANDASSAKNKYVEKALDAIILGNKVGQNSTKAIGCTIKWKDA